MGNRLSKIYTKTGDDGTTGLGDGSRVAKNATRVEAYGTVDEANSAIGIILTFSTTDFIFKCLTNVQHDLFELGGELCIPGHVAIKDSFVKKLLFVIARVLARIDNGKEVLWDRKLL